MKPLTPKQSRFVEEYLCDLCAAKAAVRAGYSGRRADAIGYELLRKPEIAFAIDAAKAERSKAVGVDAGYVLRQAVDLHERCMREDDFRPAAAARALELVGRHLGCFVERKEHSGSVQFLVTTGLPARMQAARERVYAEAKRAKPDACHNSGPDGPSSKYLQP